MRDSVGCRKFELLDTMWAQRWCTLQDFRKEVAVLYLLVHFAVGLGTSTYININSPLLQPNLRNHPLMAKVQRPAPSWCKI